MADPALEASPRRQTPKPQEPLRITTADLSVPPTIRPVDSPTLGMPGSFPIMISPSIEQEEIPQSAVTTTSEFTEFDAEPQTEPPTQESVTTIGDELELGISRRSDALGMVPAITHLSPTLHQIATYQYPFEDEVMVPSCVSPGVPPDHSVHTSPQLTPTRSEFDLDAQTEPPVPEHFQDEYEPQPFTFPSENYETTVKILGPETDFRPSYSEEVARDPSQALEDDVVFDERFPLDDGHGVSVSNEAQGIDDFQHESAKTVPAPESFYVAPRMHENVTTLRDSAFTSSDQDGSYETVPSSAEFQKTPETTHSLSVPPCVA